MTITSEFNASPELEHDLRQVFTLTLGAGIVLGVISIIGAFGAPAIFSTPI